MLVTDDVAKKEMKCYRNVNSEKGEFRTCLGSACMAWEWYPIHQLDMGCEDSEIETGPIENITFTSNKGYCAAAGRPYGYRTGA
jgi:hypothetical protein